MNWGYYCTECSSFYYGVRECPTHRPPFKEAIRQYLLEILHELRRR